MDRRTIHEKIAEITELININNNRLFLHDDKIAQIEIDLLRKNAIELYEQINLLHITNLKAKTEVKLTDASHDLIALKDESIEETETYSAPEKEIEFIVETPAKVEIKEEKIEVVPPPAEPVIATEPPSAEEVEEEIAEEEIPEIIPIETPTKKAAPAIEKNEENTIREKPTSLPSDIQPELFEIKTVADTSSKNKTEKPSGDIKHIFEKYRTSKIDSIKKAISILKKYEFQNQLFGNDPKTYNQAIEMLDQAANAEVAVSLLENSWPAQYNWGEKEEKLIEELKELVFRRFS